MVGIKQEVGKYVQNSFVSGTLTANQELNGGKSAFIAFVTKKEGDQLAINCHVGIIR